MKRVSIAQAASRLPALIHEVERHEPVEVMRHGRSVAVIVAIEDYVPTKRRKKRTFLAVSESMREDGLHLADCVLPRDPKEDADR